MQVRWRNGVCSDCKLSEVYFFPDSNSIATSYSPFCCSVADSFRPYIIFGNVISRSSVYLSPSC